MQTLKGKVVVITGASTGIGKAIAIELAKNDIKVVLGARNILELEKVADEIRGYGHEAIFQRIDVRIKKDLEQLVNLAVSHYGKLDVIINNAGIAKISSIDELDTEGWDEMVDINLKGTLY